MERKSRARWESGGFIAVILISLVLVNALSAAVFSGARSRTDLTKRQLYTLSAGTHRIMGGLADDLAVTVYFTPGQPPPFGEDERFLREQLEEYEALAPRHVHVRWVATDNEARRHEADAAGCEKRPLQSVDASQQQATLMEAYRCVAFEYLGRRDKIDFLAPGGAGLEYEISSIVRNLRWPENRERTIGFLGGHGEQTPDEGLQFLTQLLDQERISFRVRTVNLNNGADAVPTDIRGLIIANPTRRIEERELRQIDNYLMHGGSVAIFASGVNMSSVDPREASGAPAEHHLNDLLDGYGLHLDTNVLLDLRSSDGVVRMGRAAARVRLVTWPQIAAVSGTPSQSDLRSQGGLDPDFAAVFRLPEFITTYPSSVGVDETRIRAGGCRINERSAPSGGCNVRVFARTGPMSIRREGDFDLNILEILQQGRGLFEDRSRPHGPYPVGVALEGNFRSAFPRREGAEAPVVAAPERAERPGRILVVSTGSIFTLDLLRTMAQLTGGRPANLTLLFNTFDYLAGDLELLAIRAKDTTEPSLRADVSPTAMKVFQWGVIAILPLAVGILGLAITSARRGRRRRYVLEYGTRDTKKL